MEDLEIPLGKRAPKYRFFEMLPAIISYGALILMVVLSFINPTIAAIYLLIIIVTNVVKAVGIAYYTIKGRSQLEAAQNVNWHYRLKDLENPARSLNSINKTKYDNDDFDIKRHIKNLEIISQDREKYPKPSEIYQAVIIATYNESYGILGPTLQSILDSTYDKDKMIIVLAYEKRGGEETKRTALMIKEEFGNKFGSFQLVEHPDDIPNEVVGKGGNITFAGKHLQKWLKKQNINSSNVVVTTVDADNHPYPSYFDYLAYEYIVRENRKQLSYQPICLFLTNIWDAPAPMRVIATGNSFWNIISSMKPHTLRNFASHSQPMDALEEMNFWSTRTIVEDGHQFWRSYFHFKGHYSVVPIYVPIYQDAVLCETYKKTMKAQFIQQRRWAYGASDVPYVASRIFSRKRDVPLLDSLNKLIVLIDGHVTLACVAILVTVGGWIPLIVNSEASRSISANQLPDVVSRIQQVAMIGLFITVFLSMKMLPPRPERYKKVRSVAMIAQWVLMPFTSIFYSAGAALNSQGRLFIGKYLDKFDVTDKATMCDIDKIKESKKTNKPINK